MEYKIACIGAHLAYLITGAKSFAPRYELEHTLIYHMPTAATSVLAISHPWSKLACGRMDGSPCLFVIGCSDFAVLLALELYR